MDNFLDVIIVRKNKGLFNIIYLLASLIMFVSVIFSAIFLFRILDEPAIGTGIYFLVSGGIAFLLYRYRPMLKVDYDLSFTNGFVELARVANNVRRKELCKFYMNEVESGGYTSTPGYKRYEGMKNIKRYNAVLNRGIESFYLFFTVKDQRALVIFEENEELIGLMHKYNPKNVKITK